MNSLERTLGWMAAALLLASGASVHAQQFPTGQLGGPFSGGGIPQGVLPQGAIPAGAISAGAIPAGAIPAGAIPAGAIPAGAIPAGAIPAGAIPAGAIPAGAIPAGAIPGGGNIVAIRPTPPTEEEVAALAAEKIEDESVVLYGKRYTEDQKERAVDNVLDLIECATKGDKECDIERADDDQLEDEYDEFETEKIEEALEDLGVTASDDDDTVRITGSGSSSGSSSSSSSSSPSNSSDSDFSTSGSDESSDGESEDLSGEVDDEGFIRVGTNAESGTNGSNTGDAQQDLGGDSGLVGGDSF